MCVTTCWPLWRAPSRPETDQCVCVRICASGCKMEPDRSLALMSTTARDGSAPPWGRYCHSSMFVWVWGCDCSYLLSFHRLEKCVGNNTRQYEIVFSPRKYCGFEKNISEYVFWWLWIWWYKVDMIWYIWQLKLRFLAMQVAWPPLWSRLKCLRQPLDGLPWIFVPWGWILMTHTEPSRMLQITSECEQS